MQKANPPPHKNTTQVPAINTKKVNRVNANGQKIQKRTKIPLSRQLLFKKNTKEQKTQKHKKAKNIKRAKNK